MKKFKIALLGMASLAALGTLASCSTQSQTVIENEDRILLAQEGISAMNTIDTVTDATEETQATETQEATETTVAPEETTEAQATEATETEPVADVTETTETDNKVDVDMDEINSLINKASVLAENKLLITVEESDREGYIEKQIIKYGDKEFILYVAEKDTDTKSHKKHSKDETEEIPADETVVPTEEAPEMTEVPTDVTEGVETIEDTDNSTQLASSKNMKHKHHHKHHHDDEDEVKYKGIIVYEGNEYEFKAKQETEEDDDETETKFKLVVTIDEENQIIIKAKDEVQDDETETKFSCKYETNGEVTSEFSVKVEIEDGEKEIKITEDGISYKLKYYEEDGTNYLKLSVKDNYKILLSITLDEEGNTVYTVIEAE